MATDKFGGELVSTGKDKFGGTLVDDSGSQEKPKGPGAIRKAGDLAAGLVGGAVGATKALTDVAGAGNAASNFLDSAGKDIDSLLSPQAQADKQEQSAILKDAEGKGAYEGVKAGLKAFSVAPVQTTMSGLGSVIPVAAATMATGGGTIPAMAAGAATGMAMGAGTVKGAIYDDIKKRGLESGMTPEAAEAAADKAQAYGGGNADQIAVGAGLGALDAATGVTPIVANLARKAVGREAVKALTTNTGHGIIRRTATGALEEIPLEAAQGGQEQLAANLAAQRAGYQAGTWDNVASNATLEGLASVGPGAAFGAMSGNQPAAAPPAETLAEPTPEVPAALQLGFNPGAGTATVFPDGSVVLNSESSNGAKTVRDMQRENRLANVGRENLAPVNPAEPDAASFASILDTDQVYEGWSNVRDGTDRSIMRGQMAYVASNYGGIATEENRDALNQELSAQFKWFKAAPLEQRNAALDSLIANPAPAKPSVAMGLDPAAGPMSAAAALAVDTGVNKPTMDESLTGTDSAIQLQRAAQGNNPLQEAMRANQSEADAAIPLDAATEADRRAYEDAFDRPAPPEYMGLPSDARKAILYGNKEVNDGGKQFPGTQDGDILNGMSTPFKTRFAAAKRARMMGEGWTIAPVPDGFVARWKGPSNVSNTGDVPGLAAAADGGRSDQTGSGVGAGVGAFGVAGPALDARGAGVAPVGGFVPQRTGARQDAVGAKGPISNPTLPTDPGGTTTPVIEDKKTKWLKAINDQNRLAGSTGIQLTVVDGKLTFMGDPRSSKQGQALNATFEEAQKAGATIPEIIASIQSLQKTATQPGQTNAASTQAAPEAPAISSATPGLPAAGANADAQVDGENPATQLQGATTDAATPANPGTQTSPAPSAQGAPKAGTAVANPAAPGAVARKAPPNSVIKDVRDFDGNKLADIVVPHDGTKAGILKAADKANRQMIEQWGNSATHSGSRIGATDENGNPAWVISPNLEHVEPFGTREGAYIFGDLSAEPDKTKAMAGKTIADIYLKKESDMTDSELSQLQESLGKDHPRAYAITSEIGRRTGSKKAPDSAITLDNTRKDAPSPEKQKALDRIASGKAWFGNAIKAQQFIAQNGLKDTHQAVKSSDWKRWDVTAAADQTIDDAAHQAATSKTNDLAQPTDGQKKAGNYAKGHVILNGLDLSIENPAGSERSGTDKSGKAWTNTLQHHYGYIKGTMGNDKDHVDLFVKPGTPLDFNGDVYVIDQVHPETGKFDEHKVMTGFANQSEAKAAYHANYAKGWKGMKALTPMSFSDFSTWVKAGPKNTPLSEETKPATQGATSEPQADKAKQAAPKRPPEPAAAAEPVATASANPKIKAALDKKNGDGQQDELDAEMMAYEGRNNPVPLPTPVADAFAKQMKSAQTRMKALRTAAKADGLTLAQKLEAQTKVKAAESTLRAMRTSIFDAEDAAVKAVKDNDVQAFSAHEMLFPAAHDELAKLFGKKSDAPAPAVVTIKPVAKPGEPTAEQIAAIGDITIEVPTANGPAKMTVNAATIVKSLNARADALEMVKRCIG